MPTVRSPARGAAPSPRRSPPPSPAGRARPARLWLALHLPALALEALRPPGLGPAGAGAPGPVPCAPLAVIDGPERAPLVVAVDPRARRAGVRPGLGAPAATALAPALVLVRRDPALEAAALEGLATWCAGLTPLVSLLPPDALVAEIGAGLRLLGGVEGARGRFAAGALALGHRACAGIAPTPLAAWLLARAGGAEPILDPARLAGGLAGVDLAAAGLEPRTVERLHGMGVRRLGDLVRLPRDGLARRFGPGLVAWLDRVLGRRPDPRAPWSPPETFARRLPLPAPARDMALLLEAARRLLLELAGFLAARGAGARCLEVHLAHRGLPATRLALRLMSPARDPEHLRDLLRVRLERVDLPAPVEHVGLRADDLVPLPPAARDLLGRRPAPGEGADGRILVERLRARLGEGAVHGLAPVPDHRPERAWRAVPPGAPPPCGAGPIAAGSGAARPISLLPEPVPLATAGGWPCRGGRLEILEGPERIETGWWDGAGIARDYYVARAPGGACYWIFRERGAAGRWYLHGVFA